MGSRQNIIELNGKRYDARTGQQLPAQQTATSTSGTTYVRPAAHAGVSLDGMSKKSTTPARPATPAAHVVHQRTEHSKTLMRHAVKKPQIDKTTTPAVQKSPSKAAHSYVSETRRLGRAQKVPRSQAISRFGSTEPKGITPTFTSVLPVRPAPIAPQPPVLDEHHQTKLDTHTHQEGSFQHAIDKATSHKQTPAKAPSRHHRAARRLRVSPKILSVSTATLAALLLGGFFAYQNVPNLSMHVATARAGMNGSLPSYKPAGFALSGPIQYKKGQITVSYKSHSDTRQFNINQRASNWNGQSLLDEFVATNKRQYQTYQSDGKTIYIYDQNNATWVDRGIWYQIEGNSALSSDQLLRLASSM